MHVFAFLKATLYRILTQQLAVQQTCRLFSLWFMVASGLSPENSSADACERDVTLLLGHGQSE